MTGNIRVADFLQSSTLTIWEFYGRIGGLKIFQSVTILLRPEKGNFMGLLFRVNLHHLCEKLAWKDFDSIWLMSWAEETNQNVILPLLVVPHFKRRMPSVINYYFVAGWRLQEATVSSLLNLSTRVLQVDIKSLVMSAWSIHDLIGLTADTPCSLNLERKVRIQRTDGNWLK